MRSCRIASSSSPSGEGKLSKKLDRQFIDDVKAACDIVEVISRYVDLSESSAGLCPFHDDTKPSLKVYPETQSWFCFGCNEGGDVIEFIMKSEGTGFTETVTALAKEAGIHIYQRPSGRIRRERRRTR